MWLFPWDMIQWDSTISISYIFDLLVVASLTVMFRLKFYLGTIAPAGMIARALSVAGAACFALMLASVLKLAAPFKYVELLEVQILFLAPIIEELVFRHALFGAFKSHFKNENMLILSNAIFFSISHLPAIWALPPVFHSFIYLQLFYTLILGWICAKSRLRTGSVVEPMLLHFIFNLIFYVAVIKGII